MTVSDTGIAGSRDFPATSWSMIRNARDPGAPEYQRHLRQLIELYWRPVYCVIRHAWARTNDDAKDLTQEFFATVVCEGALARDYAPERGSFRALLRTSITNFMRNSVRDARRKKRGGDQLFVSLDAGDPALLDLSQVTHLSPDEVFDTAWNQTVVARAVALVQQRLQREGKSVAFEVFRRYDLDGASAELSYADLGATMELTGPQVKHALLHARGAFRDVVTELVRDYVDSAEDLAAELRQLLRG